MKIGIARTDAEVEACFEVMRELRPCIRREDFLPIVREIEREGYAL